MAIREKPPEPLTPLTAQAFARLMPVSRETIVRLECYSQLLHKWQKTINLVSRDSLADLWRRHFLDSAQLAELIPADRPITILDMGSGAGFPGLILAILALEQGRDWTTHLVESDGRKAAFLATVTRETGIRTVIHNKRIENLDSIQVDVITARALASLDILNGYGVRFLAPEGYCLWLKGVGAEDELTAAYKTWKMQVERIPSRSGSTGVILRIREISRVKSN